MLNEKDCWMKIWGWPMGIDLYVVPHYKLRFMFTVSINGLVRKQRGYYERR